MPEGVIGVVEHEHREVRRVLPHAAEGEAGRARGMKRRRRAPAVEAAQVHREVVELLRCVRHIEACKARLAPQKFFNLWRDNESAEPGSVERRTKLSSNTSSFKLLQNPNRPGSTTRNANHDLVASTTPRSKNSMARGSRSKPGGSPTTFAGNRYANRARAPSTATRKPCFGNGWLRSKREAMHQPLDASR